MTPHWNRTPLPHCTPNEKLALDPNYYPQNYDPIEKREDAPLLVNNFGTPPETAQSEEQEKENKVETREDSKQEKEEEDEKKDSMKTLVDLWQEADEEEDSYFEYSDYDFIY